MIRIKDEFVESDERLESLEIQDLQMAGLIPPPDLNPEELFRIEEARDKINQIFFTLSPREEKVVRMCIWDGLTFDEIGEKLGVTEEKIKAIKAKAMRKLRHPSRSAQLRDYIISGF